MLWVIRIHAAAAKPRDVACDCCMQTKDTLLHVAASFGHVHILKLLCSYNDALINKRNSVCDKRSSLLSVCPSVCLSVALIHSFLVVHVQCMTVFGLLLDYMLQGGYSHRKTGKPGKFREFKSGKGKSGEKAKISEK